MKIKLKSHIQAVGNVLGPQNMNNSISMNETKCQKKIFVELIKNENLSENRKNVNNISLIMCVCKLHKLFF